MANQNEIQRRKDLISKAILENGLTKKSHIVRYIRFNDVLSKEFKKLSDVQIRRYITFPKGDDIIDDGHYIKGRSIHKNAEGKVISEWVKTDTNKELLEQSFKESIKALQEDLKPYKPVNLLEIDRSPNLINQYTITDFHLGMFSWACESGNEWSSEIAENLLVKWFEKAIQTSPKAKKCIFAQIGDFMHFDGLEPVTPQSKHVLDADVRYHELVRMAMRVIRRVVEMLLVKYESVELINVEGNHDMASSVWLKETFHMLYENEPRVNVDRTPLPYHCYSESNLCLFYAHSHTKKLGALDTVFVSNYKKEFASADHVYGHTGHYHHQIKQESNLMILEQHATLSAKDAYAVRGGYSSKRCAVVITYHLQYGEVGRNTISPQMLN